MDGNDRPVDLSIGALGIPGKLKEKNSQKPEDCCAEGTKSRYILAVWQRESRRCSALPTRVSTPMEDLAIRLPPRVCSKRDSGQKPKPESAKMKRNSLSEVTDQKFGDGSFTRRHTECNKKHEDKTENYVLCARQKEDLDTMNALAYSQAMQSCSSPGSPA